jgi:hypothetical protein
VRIVLLKGYISEQKEIVFEQMKFNTIAYKRFRHKLFAKVQLDFGNFTMAFNLKKLCRSVSKEAFVALLDKLKHYMCMLFSLKVKHFSHNQK